MNSHYYNIICPLNERSRSKRVLQYLRSSWFHLIGFGSGRASACCWLTSVSFFFSTGILLHITSSDQNDEIAAFLNEGWFCQFRAEHHDWWHMRNMLTFFLQPQGRWTVGCVQDLFPAPHSCAISPVLQSVRPQHGQPGDHAPMKTVMILRPRRVCRYSVEHLMANISYS